MERFAPYLGIVAALTVGVLIVALSGTVTVERPPSATSLAASSTLAVLPPISWPAIMLPALSSSTVLSEPHAAPPPAPAEPPAPVPHETTPPQTVPPPETNTATEAPAPASDSNISDPTLDASSVALRAALVNILCYAPPGSSIRSISGSGIVVSPKGLILTNAHVAQYFLLADQGVSCTIRTGSPARDAYTATLAFISPAWVQDNASLITSAAPSGTGEHDYAFLAISGAAPDAAPASAPFSYLPIAAYPPSVGTPVVIGSYGAQFLATGQIQSSLFPTLVLGSVKEVFTFDTSTVDVVSLGGSAAAQEGSSGGGAADDNGALVATITTSTVTGATDTRTLNAITTSYIRAAYAGETGSPLEFLLTEATSTAVTNFTSERASLEADLLAAIRG